jgi:hypothetical protein
MKTPVLVASGVVVFAVYPCAALGSLIVSLNNPGSTTLHEVEVAPGSTFDVDITAAPITNMVWLAFEISASAEGLLTLTGATLHDPWDESRSVVPLGPLAPTSETFVLNVSSLRPQPVYSPLITLNLDIASDVQPGTYALNVMDVYWKETYVDLSLPFRGQPGEPFVVHVVPEPVPVTLLLFAALLSRWLSPGGKDER